ncbi:unnamed protein product [Trichogramma brassicae]|uniref:Secreted protein n=1 Tax=Trichogramma brassicae TaxID=86971 RepID=A0A6H5I6B6_9HYME|nr:unnamed protein product [Trichogramma brassicae]
MAACRLLAAVRPAFALPSMWPCGNDHRDNRTTVDSTLREHPGRRATAIAIDRSPILGNQLSGMSATSLPAHMGSGCAASGCFATAFSSLSPGFADFSRTATPLGVSAIRRCPGSLVRLCRVMASRPSSARPLASGAESHDS